MKTLLIHNTSRHPADQVRWLAEYAYRYVRSEAVRNDWVDRFDRHPVALRVRNTQHAYSGVFQGTSYLHRIEGFSRGGLEYDGMVHTPVWDVVVRIGKATKFPVDSTYPRYKDMPEARLNDWQEAVVGLCTHEMAHIKYDYSAGKRKADEECCEWTEIDCVERFRKERALFDTFVEQTTERAEFKRMEAAARRTPQALAASHLADMELKVAFWARRAKAAANKLKLYERKLKFAKQRSAKLGQGGVS